ncbi:MAG: hypothetical protein EBV23_08940 [Flavobacteriia bacterium]|nr:hypothetical protein [Flavobacteriia bacterium]
MNDSVLIFDVESDGLIPQMTTIHCLCVKDTMQGITYRFSSQQGNVKQGVDMLAEASVIVGHNIIDFDIPAIKKLYPNFQPSGCVYDTIVCSRLIWTDLKEKDFARVVTDPSFPKQLIGSNSLKAWGYRVGVLKGDYKESDKADFSKWSKEMEDYCVQDVEVTERLWKIINSKNYSLSALTLEHQFAEIMQRQQEHGFVFDVEKAQKLYVDLCKKRLDIEKELQKVFEPEKQVMKSTLWTTPDGKVWATKKEAVSAGYKAKDVSKGQAKIKETPFNPGSRDQIAERFIKKYGWKPIEFTPDGKAKIDEAVLNELAYPEAKPLCEYLMVQKRIGQLAEGNEAWIKLEKKGKIHGRIITNGAVTGRCTHKNPNMAQVPSVGSPYGKECRSLFTVPKGYKLVGADASGIELRCLAHYMARFDDGDYARLLLTGDIHTENQKAAGLPTRADAKTFIYAFLYGAGDEKIGKIIGKGVEAGKQIKSAFLKKTPALQRLKEEIDGVLSNRDWLIGLDGRQLMIRSKHAALNTLLQSAGALIMKQATIMFYNAMSQRGYAWGREYAIVAHIHDEIQIQVKEDLADQVGQLAVLSIKEAGQFFKFRCPLDGEYRIGNNWAETH